MYSATAVADRRAGRAHPGPRPVRDCAARRSCASCSIPRRSPPRAVLQALTADRRPRLDHVPTCSEHRDLLTISRGRVFEDRATADTCCRLPPPGYLSRSGSPASTAGSPSRLRALPERRGGYPRSACLRRSSDRTGALRVLASYALTHGRFSARTLHALGRPIVKSRTRWSGCSAGRSCGEFRPSGEREWCERLLRLLRRRSLARLRRELTGRRRPRSASLPHAMDRAGRRPGAEPPPFAGRRARAARRGRLTVRFGIRRPS